MQLLGVYDDYLVEPLAQVLINLGIKRGMVVYGQDKLDEISMSAPTIVRDFQAVISKEIREQLFEKEGRLPDAVIACVGGGSHAIGSFYHFIGEKSVRLIGCEAAGRGVDTFETAATIATGRLGIFHGMKSMKDAIG